jgi:hypothetical protein
MSGLPPFPTKNDQAQIMAICWNHHSPRLKPINSGQYKHALKDRPCADQHHEYFEKIGKTTVRDELFDGPKTNGADDANDQNSD